MIHYFLNTHGRKFEIVDELDTSDFSNYRLFKAEQARLSQEYALCGQAGIWRTHKALPRRLQKEVMQSGRGNA